MNNKQSKTSMGNGEKNKSDGGKETKVNQGNRLLAHGMADASSLTQEVAQHLSKYGKLLNRIKCLKCTITCLIFVHCV